MATSEGRAMAPLPADAVIVTNDHGNETNSTNEPPPPYPPDNTSKTVKSAPNLIATHIGLTKSSRFREFHTLTIPLSTTSGASNKQSFTVERLRVKRHAQDYYMPTADIIKNIIDRITAEYSALVDHIDDVTKEYPAGTQLMISHLEGHLNTGDLADPNLTGTLIVELIPFVPGSNEWGHYREFYLLGANSRKFDAAGLPDPDNFESRDWLHGPLDGDLIGIVNVKSDAECLSKDNNVREEVLKWWEKTMHVLSEFARRMSMEFYGGKDVVVNSAYTYIDEKYKSSLKVVELVPIDKAPPFMEVHILPSAIFWDLASYPCLTFNSEFVQEKNRPFSYSAGIYLRLTNNSSEKTQTGDEINSLLYNSHSPRLEAGTLKSMGITSESGIRTIRNYIKREIAYWQSRKAYPAPRDMMVNWIAVRPQVYRIWSDDRRTTTPLKCYFTAIAFGSANHAVIPYIIEEI